MSTRPTPHPTILTGHDLVDDAGRDVGRITDVIYEGNAIDTPTWLVVDPGFLRAEHVVPVKRSYVAADGSVVVPYDKRSIMQAPKAPRGHVLSPEIRSDLLAHYGPESVR